MQKMSNGDYFDEKMRHGDRSKEARRISPPLKLLLKSPKLRGSTAPKSAHLHRGREQGALWVRGQFGGPCKENLCWEPRGQKSQQEELRGDGGEKGLSRRFFTFTGK